MRALAPWGERRAAPIGGNHTSAPTRTDSAPDTHVLMTADVKLPGGSPLERWSQRKLLAARRKGAPPAAASPAAAPAAVVGPAPPEGAQPVAAAPTVAQLPSVESLTIESDFAPFFQPKVGETLKRQALKQLLRDPHFNVMDGLDVYVGDYSQPDPIDPDVVRQMVQGRYIFDPPATRINAQGHVEDVPPEEIASGVDG